MRKGLQIMRMNLSFDEIQKPLSVSNFAAMMKIEHRFYLTFTVLEVLFVLVFHVAFFGETIIF